MALFCGFAPSQVAVGKPGHHMDWRPVGMSLVYVSHWVTYASKMAQMSMYGWPLTSASKHVFSWSSTQLSIALSCKRCRSPHCYLHNCLIYVAWRIRTPCTLWLVYVYIICWPTTMSQDDPNTVLIATTLGSDVQILVHTPCFSQKSNMMQIGWVIWSLQLSPKGMGQNWLAPNTPNTFLICIHS